MRCPAPRRLSVPWVAPLTAQGLARDGLRVHLRWSALGFDARCGLRVLLHGRRQALKLSGAQRGAAEIEFARSSAQASAVGQHAGGPPQDLRIPDAVSALSSVAIGALCRLANSNMDGIVERQAVLLGRYECEAQIEP